MHTLVFPMNLAISSATITMLQSTFAPFGLSETIISNNGSCFVSEEFKLFLSRNDKKHITLAPYHPSSNGLAKRAVQILKAGLKKNTTGSLHTRIARILLAYRSSTTGVAISELLFGRRIRTQLDLVKLSLAKDVESFQFKSKVTHDLKAKDRNFSVGNPVFVKNFVKGKNGLLGR